MLHSAGFESPSPSRSLHFFIFSFPLASDFLFPVSFCFYFSRCRYASIFLRHSHRRKGFESTADNFTSGNKNSVRLPTPSFFRYLIFVRIVIRENWSPNAVRGWDIFVYPMIPLSQTGGCCGYLMLHARLILMTSVFEVHLCMYRMLCQYTYSW